MYSKLFFENFWSSFANFTYFFLNQASIRKKSLKIDNCDFNFFHFDDNYTFCGLDICRKGNYSHDVPQRFLQHGLLWLLPLSQEPISRGRRQTIRFGLKEQFRGILEDSKIFRFSYSQSYFKFQHFLKILKFSNIFLFDASIMDIFIRSLNLRTHSNILWKKCPISLLKQIIYFLFRILEESIAGSDSWNPGLLCQHSLRCCQEQVR